MGLPRSTTVTQVEASATRDERMTMTTYHARTKHDWINGRRERKLCRSHGFSSGLARTHGAFDLFSTVVIVIPRGRLRAGLAWRKGLIRLERLERLGLRDF